MAVHPHDRGIIPAQAHATKGRITTAHGPSHLNTTLPALLAEYLERYQGRNGRLTVKSRLTDLFRTTGASHPAQLTTRSLLAWITHGSPANNTVRARLATARTFLRWCHQSGHIDTNPAELLPNITRQYPTTYGKVQSANPARWLDHHQAFTLLLGACQDGTWIGTRDELAIRLGLLGIRVSETIALTWGNYLPDGRLSWTGKGRRPRTVTPGPTLTDLLDRWRHEYAQRLGQPLTNNHPLLCRQLVSRWRTDLAWGQPIKAVQTYHDLLHRRASLAGLGHVAPHDLRRSAAGILHNATTADGAHLYDLLDIQRVLDHADPATTMRSYIQPMADALKARAGHTLD